MRCVAFCQTEAYKLSAIAGFFRSRGCTVKLFRQVLYVAKPQKHGEFFVFSYGCLVTWGLKKAEEVILLEQLKSYTNTSHTTEIARFIYHYADHTEINTHERFNIDIILLESDNIQLKLAFSYGLAQSIQLESYESFVQKTIDANTKFPKQLASSGTINLSRKLISKRLGEIFIARSFINLNSEYLTAPEYFWEHPSLENYYNSCKRFLDIPRRVSALNQKLDVLHELFEMLTSQLQYRHSNLLETIVIALILIEIAISLILA